MMLTVAVTLMVRETVDADDLSWPSKLSSGMQAGEVKLLGQFKNV